MKSLCRIFAAVALLVVAAIPSSARFPHGTASGGGGFTPFVSPLKIGAGGWNTGVVIANDGTRYTRTDTYGAFKYNSGTGLWEQLVTKARMPAAAFGYFPATGTSQVNQQSTGGVYEIDVVPSDSSKVYMIYSARLFASTDGGATWVLRNLPAQPDDGQGKLDPNGAYRQNGKKMAVDPGNYLHLFVGTSQNGLYESTDGGVNFTSVTGVPTALTGSGGYPGYNIAFDPSSTFSGGKTQTVYAFGYTGTAQMYKTTNGGTTWTATTGGPTTMDRMIVAPSGGVVWATDSANGNGGNGGNLWKYNGTSWTQVSGATPATWVCGVSSGNDNCHSIAVDPNDATHIIAVTPGGNVSISTNSGTSFAYQGNKTIAGTDVPWLPNTGGIQYMAVGDVVFDKSVAGFTMMGMGLGTFVGTPAIGSVTWTSLNAGQEQLVAMEGIAPNGVPVVGNEDRATFRLASPNSYPSAQNNPYHDSFSLAVTYGLDYAAGNKNFMAALITTSFGNAGNNSGTSSDGGVTWKPFNSYYQEGIAFTSVVNDGTNKVKITVPSTTGLTTWANGSGSIVRVVGYTNSNMTSGLYWPVTVNDATHITLQGSSTLTNFNLPTTGTAFVYAETQPLSNYNGGLNVTNAANNGSGLVRVTFVNTSSNLSNGQKICISGVVGTTEANGCFVTTGVTGTTADLLGTTFTNTYVSGGVGKYLIFNGGTIAVADANNMTILPSNNTYPICTTDGGQTWSEKIIPAGIATGAETGWGYAYYTFRHAMVADRVTPNTFYGYNYLQGVYKWTNCGTPTIVSGSALNGGTPNTATANLFPSGSVASSLKSVPGNAGHLFFAPGAIGTSGSTHPATTNLFRSTDGGQNWYTVANVAEPIKFDCGAIAPGSDYPTCYLIGWVNNVYGTWRTTGTAAQWGSAGTTGAGLTWVQVADYPLGSMDGPQAIVADGVTWNMWYQGFSGSGWAYGQQN